jgi:hypothetical protein
MRTDQPLRTDSATAIGPTTTSQVKDHDRVIEPHSRPQQSLQQQVDNNHEISGNPGHILSAPGRSHESEDKRTGQSLRRRARGSHVLNGDLAFWCIRHQLRTDPYPSIFDRLPDFGF